MQSSLLTTVWPKNRPHVPQRTVMYDFYLIFVLFWIVVGFFWAENQIYFYTMNLHLKQEQLFNQKRTFQKPSEIISISEPQIFTIVGELLTDEAVILKPNQEISATISPTQQQLFQIKFNETMDEYLLKVRGVDTINVCSMVSVQPIENCENEVKIY